MRLTVVGCSPAWPNPGGAHSGYLVEEDGQRLLLDCGPGVLSRLLERERWPRVDAIAITHLHLDHWGDLVSWVLGVRYGTGREVERRPELWLPPGGAEALLDLAARLTSAALFEHAFTIREHDGDASFRAAGFEVTPRSVPHYDTQCYALRVGGNERVLAYSADCGPSEQLVETAREADLFLCEATLAEPEPEPRGHLTLAEALEAFQRSQARRLLVVHRPAEYPSAPDVELARDGLELDV